MKKKTINVAELQSILSDTINDVKSDKIDTKKASTIARLGGVLIKTSIAEITYRDKSEFFKSIN